MTKNQTERIDKSKKEEEELNEFMNGINKENIIFISCVEPTSIKEITEFWNYKENSLYGREKGLLQDNRISLHHEEESPYGLQKEKFYLANFDILFQNFMDSSRGFNFSPFLNNFDDLKKIYSGKLKSVLSLKYLRKIFDNPKNAMKYYYAVMPQILCLLPICIKLVQRENNNLIALGTIANHTPERFPSPIRIFIRKFLFDTVDEFKDVKIPDELTTKRLFNSVYEWIFGKSNIGFGEKREMRERFSKKKYKYFFQ